MNSGFNWDLWLVVVVAVATALAACLVILALIVLARSRKKPATPDAAAGEGAIVTKAAEVTRGSASGFRFSQALSSTKGLADRVPWFLVVGESGSGKTTLVGQLSGDPGEMGLPKAPQLTAGVGWHFLDQAVLIDVPGDFLTGTPSLPADTESWAALLKALAHHRPTRPLEGIVLTISALDLLSVVREPQEPSRMLKARQLGECLTQLQRQTGLTVPVYVLITKADALRGFSSFCWGLDADVEQDIFGWSNPYSAQTNFSGAWIDEAFDLITQTVQRRQMEMFAREGKPRGVDDLFLFPFEVQSLREPLRAFLWPIFRPTVYREAHILRGIYFCGDAIAVPELAPPAPADEAQSVPALAELPMGGDSRRRLAFVSHLFEFKIWLEHKIARPVSGTFLSRNRLVLACQAGALASTLVLGSGLLLAYLRLSHAKAVRFEPLILALEEQASHKGKSAQASAPLDKRLADAYSLVETLGYLDAKGFRSIFIPASWTDPVDKGFGEVMVAGFEGTVLDALKLGIEQRYQDLTRYNAAAASQACPSLRRDSQADAGGGIYTSSLDVTGNSAYRELDAYVDRAGQLNDITHIYERLRLPGAGGIDDIAKILFFLTGKTIQNEERYHTNPYYREAMEKAEGDPLKTISYVQCARQQTGDLIANFYAEWFGDNPLLRALDEVKDGVDRIEQSQAREYDQLRQITTTIHEAEAMVSSPASQWIQSRDFSRMQYPVLNAPLRKVPGVDEAFLKKIEASGVEEFSQFRDGLTTMESKQGRPIIELRGESVHLSGEVLSLAASLDYLLDLDFMSQRPEFGIAQLSSDGVIWNREMLAIAARFFDNYATYVREGLMAVPAGFRAPLRTAAARRLVDNIGDAVVRAQLGRERVARQETPTQSQLYLEIQSFALAVGALRQISAEVARVPDSQAAFVERRISEVLASQAASLARRLDALIAAEQPYAPKSGGFESWNDSSSLALTAFAAPSTEDLTQYLDRERERFRDLAQDYAGPLLHYLESPTTPKSADVNTIVARWKSIVADLKLYDGKKPGNPIGVLEQFIRTGMDTITPENRCAAPIGDPVRGDYFLGRRAALRGLAVDRCHEILAARYETLADFFNTRLAGRFPFAPGAAKPDAAEADPVDVMSFYEQFDPNAPGLIDVLAHDPAYTASAPAVAKFIHQMQAVRPFVASTSDLGVPVVDFDVEFRVNQSAEAGGNRIIDWLLQVGQQQFRYRTEPTSGRWVIGDPVSVSLRYAKDAPVVPAAPGSQDSHLAGRTVTFSYSNRWALIALLRTHAGLPSDFDRLADPMPNTLRFLIPTSPDPAITQSSPPNPGDTLVFIRVAVSQPSPPPAKGQPAKPEAAKKETIRLTEFPVSAPALQIAKPSGGSLP